MQVYLLTLKFEKRRLTVCDSLNQETNKQDNILSMMPSEKAPV